MHSNLVSATGVQANFKQREAVHASQGFPVGAGLAPFATARGHPGAPLEIARNRQFDSAHVFFHAAGDKSEINFFHFARGELIRQDSMRAVIPSYYQSSGCAAIQAVDDAWADGPCSR